jgi:transposase InsO family protein
MSETEYALRKTAIHLLRGGKTPAEVAQELDRSLFWVYKWRKRFFEDQDWQALRDQSHTPKSQPRKLPCDVLQAIRQTRSELEAEADEPGKLSYIAARAIYARLRKKGNVPLPSIGSIERELRAAKLTRPYQATEGQEVIYPHLHPTQSLQLVQVDIVPHYLPGGPCVACFNAIDVVSRYPTGQQSLRKSSEDAANFLLQVWRELGIPEYTQVDNESCFSGGFTHPGVLGKVLRLALSVGTQLVFSPFRHPESNGFIERFHQDYSKNVWDKIELPDLQAVQRHSPAFFEAYRHSEHHSALNGYCPADLHPVLVHCPLPSEIHSSDRLPLTAGQVHFIRRVDQDRRVMILNLNWEVPAAKPDQGVWATLQFTPNGASLRIYDQAPDAESRVCLAEHVFLLKEAVVPLSPAFDRSPRAARQSFFRVALNLAIDSFFGLVSSMF